MHFCPHELWLILSLIPFIGIGADYLRSRYHKKCDHHCERRMKTIPHHIAYAAIVIFAIFWGWRVYIAATGGQTFRVNLF